MPSLESLSIKISLKKIVEVCPLGLLYFSIHRVKIGEKWGRLMIILADSLDYKLWWL